MHTSMHTDAHMCALHLHLEPVAGAGIFWSAMHTDAHCDAHIFLKCALVCIAESLQPCGFRRVDAHNAQNAHIFQIGIVMY